MRFPLAGNAGAPPSGFVTYVIRSFTIIALTIAGCSSDDVPAWCVALEGGVVRLADKPTGWSSPPTLELVWRVDGSEPGRELVTPTSAALSATTGRIAITDMALQEVVVISADGEWLGRWGRAGLGPGELMAPFASAWRSDGTLLVYDPVRSMLVVFDSTGTALDDERVDAAFTAALGGGARSIQLTGSGILLAEPGASFAGDGPTRMHMVLRGGPPGVPIDTVIRSDVTVIMVRGAAPMTAPGWQVPLGTVHGDSIFAVAGDRPEYMIRVFRRGRLSHVICRDVDPLPLSQDEIRPQEPNVPDAVATAMADAETPRIPARIGRLNFDAERRLWVQRDRARALSGRDFVFGRAGALLDVYGVDGLYLGEVRMPPDVRFIGAARDLVFGLESDELDVLSVVAFRIN